jgi:Uma2 family endonuclease
MPHSSTTKLTYEDLLLFPDDGRRHEIIDGEHFVSPSPKTRHQAIARTLITRFATFLQESSLGRVYPAPLDVVLSETDVVEPDLVYVSEQRRAIITEDNIRGAPDLLVEIVSDSSRRTDEIVKRKLYERFGIGEYWIIDPLLEAVKVYRRVEGSFVRVAELSAEAGDALTTPLLPGLRIDLPDLFASR